MGKTAAIAELPSAPLGVRSPHAAAYIGVSESKFREMVEDGRMPKPRSIDKIVVWDFDEVKEHFRNLPHKGGENENNIWDEAV